jgi:hypothetical protein
MSKAKEKAHNKLYADLDKNYGKAHKHLGNEHIVYLGVYFFAQVAMQTAPDEEEARELMQDAINDAIGIQTTMNPNGWVKGELH